MAYTIEQTTDAYTDTTMDRARLDPAVTSGTLLLWDSSHPDCNPAAPGALPTGTAFGNLADSGLSGGATTAAGMTYIGGAGGVSTPNATGSTVDVISFGTGYNLAPAVSFMASVWVAVLSTTAGGAYSSIFGQGASAQNSFAIDGGADNKTPRGAATTTASVPAFMGFGGAVDSVMHLAVTREGADGRLWRNGVQVGAFTAKEVPDMTGTILSLGSRRLGAKLYRASLENLTIAAAEKIANGAASWTAANAVAAEYAAGLARNFIA